MSKSKVSRALAFAWLTLGSFAFSGCLYTNIKVPLDIDLQETQLGPKVGRSKSCSVAYLVAWGDGGTAAAAADGGIEIIEHLDVRYTAYFFGLYAERETIAYGR